MAFMHGSERNRTGARLAIAGMVVVLTMCSMVGALAGSDQGVMLDVRNARLADVALLITQQVGANIVINPDVSDRMVTARMNDVPLEQVLADIVKSVGAEYWKSDSGTYFIGSQRPAETTPSEQVEPPVVPEQIVLDPPSRNAATEIIKLVNTDPTEMLITLGLRSEDESPSRRMLGLNSQPENRPLGLLDEDKFNVGIYGAGFPRPYQDTGSESVPPMIDPGSKPLGEAGRAATPSFGAAQAYPRPPGAPSRTTGTTGTRTTGPTPSGPGTAGTTGEGTLLPDGVELVMPFPTDNSLIIRGTPEGIAEFKNLVHLLDVPPKQVSIKAEFIEVSTSDVKRLGIDWSLERLNETINTNFNPAGNVVVGVTTGNLTASLRTELTRSSGKIINSPIISTINNEPAQISIGSQIPYWTSVVTAPTVGQPVQASIVNFLTVSTFLTVLPRVNGDGTITLTLLPSVQDTGRIFNAPTGDSEIPETRFQTLQTRRRVMNGETIVVGGFIRKDESTSVTEIPILGRLPIIGPLFRSTSRTGQDRELLIFVTPTIIGEKAAGSAIGVSPYP